MLSPARRSRLGVSVAFAPRKPIRSARAASSVISTMLGLDAAAADEIQRKNRLRPAKTFRIGAVIMPVSVKAVSPLIKKQRVYDQVPRVEVGITPCTIYLPAPRDPQSRGDGVHHHPSLARGWPRRRDGPP